MRFEHWPERAADYLLEQQASQEYPFSIGIEPDLAESTLGLIDAGLARRVLGEGGFLCLLERLADRFKDQVNQASLQWEPRYLDFDIFNQNHNAQERLFVDMAGEEGIEFLNLTPLVWQETIRRGELYNYMDMHWNQAGNALVAEAIGRYL